MAVKHIELPWRVVIGEGAIESTSEVVKELGLRGNALVVADENTLKFGGDAVAKELDAEILIIEGSAKQEVEKNLDMIKNGVTYIAGVGGGHVIDTGKFLAYNAGIPFLSIPTSASHDGITSPRVSLKGEKPYSVGVHSPVCIIADTKIIGNSPPRLIASGCADAISNYTAVLDWKLGRDEKGEYYGHYAASLSTLSAEIVMKTADKIKDDVSILVEALISSGVAIGIAGSSRPCSGAEHQFSHALDAICEEPALHGEQCGVGTIMMARLHEADWEEVKDALKRAGAPTDADGLGITGDDVVKALVMASSIRERYTVLRGGLKEKEAKNLATETGVIE